MKGERPLQLIRQWGVHRQLDFGQRVSESEAGGVEEHTSQSFGRAVPRVDPVTRHRVADGGKVNPDLMGAAGLEIDLE